MAAGLHSEDPESVEEHIARSQCAQQEAFERQVKRKSKKGTDIRWKYECEVLDDRLLDVAHLLAPAILIEYGVGETYSALEIDGEKNKTGKKGVI